MNFENRIIEQKEKIVKHKILTAKQLQDIIYQGESLPVDDRFKSTDDGGVFRHFSPRIFGRRDLDDYKFPIIKENDLIVGLSGLQTSPYEGQENIVWVKFVSIDPKFRNRGYGKMLVEDIFKYAEENNLVLQLSSFVNRNDHKDSHDKIKHITAEVMRKYPSVEVLDKNGKKLSMENIL